MCGRSREKPRAAGRFFVEALPQRGERFALGGAEGQHAAVVRRARPGDVVTLFDGSGWDAEARVLGVSGTRVNLEVLSRRKAEAGLAVPVTCATALPKGRRCDVLVAQCAQLGVSRLAPLEFSRSVVKLRRGWDKRRERFRRIAIEAAKQSGASTIMQIGEPLCFERFLAEAVGGLGLLGLPGAGAGVIETLQRSWPFQRLSLLVGPEGGLTAEEARAAVSAGVVPVQLAATTLRVETACSAFAAVAVAFLSQRLRGGD